MTLFAVIFLPTSFIHWLSFDFFLFFYFFFFKNETSSFWIHLTRPIRILLLLLWLQDDDIYDADSERASYKKNEKYFFLFLGLPLGEGSSRKLFKFIVAATLIVSSEPPNFFLSDKHTFTLDYRPTPVGLLHLRIHFLPSKTPCRFI